MSANGISGTNGHSNHGHASNDAFDHVVPLFIAGKEVTTNTTFDVVSPVTGRTIWKSSSVSKDQAIEAVEAAQAAFPAWSKTKPSFRRDILLKASDILKSRSDECAEYMDIETGSTDGMSKGYNVPSTIEQLRDVGGRIVTSTGYIPVAAEEGKSALIYKEPYGVVFGIAPWSVLPPRPSCIGSDRTLGMRPTFSASVPYPTPLPPVTLAYSKALSSHPAASGPSAPSSKRPGSQTVFSASSTTGLKTQPK